MNYILNKEAMNTETVYEAAHDKVDDLPNPFGVDNTMQRIYTTDSGMEILGTWSKDVGTKEKRLMLAVVYPDGEVSPVHEYKKGKLTDKRVLADLCELDGISPAIMKGAYEALPDKMKNLAVQEDSSGKCSVRQLYEMLCDYVRQYSMPGQVFVSDGFGNIRALELQGVLDRLGTGYTRREAEMNFKAWGLLRVSSRSGHLYSYGINMKKYGRSTDWFFSFRLPTGAGESEVAV